MREYTFITLNMIECAGTYLKNRALNVAEF